MKKFIIFLACFVFTSSVLLATDNQTSSEIRATINLICSGLENNKIEGIVDFFEDNHKKDALPKLKEEQRNKLAFWFRNAKIISMDGDNSVLKYEWTDDTGYNFIEFAMTKVHGRWIVTSW